MTVREYFQFVTSMGTEHRAHPFTSKYQPTVDLKISLGTCMAPFPHNRLSDHHRGSASIPKVDHPSIRTNHLVRQNYRFGKRFVWLGAKMFFPQCSDFP